jgi:hypothetical protein
MNHKTTDRHLRAKRDSALARTEITNLPKYNDVTVSMPAADMPCTGFARDAIGVYQLPFKVYYRGGLWFNSNLDTSLDVQIIGWL